MQPRTVALVASLTLGAGWVLGGRFGPGAGQAPAGGVVSPGPRPLGVEQAMPSRAFTDRLHRKLEHLPAPPRATRNPFVFGALRPQVAGARGTPAAASAPDESSAADVPPAPPGPAFRLSGMAASQQGDAVEYTAIISDGAGLHFVKRGAPLPGGYTVADVQETTVTLRDASGGERTLRLR
ncbi:MAG: hypothetical protein IT179_03135 [Acidobacteria bacterium]|nr:hypothetical protein [Acidobacteriota bacterium]